LLADTNSRPAANMTYPPPRNTMNRPLTRVALLAMAFTVASCGSEVPVADLAIRNVTVIDAESGVREARTVVVDDGRITAVTTADVAAAAIQTIDGTGRFLIPGLWDFHVHLTYDERFTEAMPGLFLNHGITSIRDTGGPLELVLPVVEAMRADGATAPRVFFAGPLLDGEYVVYDGQNRPLLGIGNPDVETARANVARLAEAGVDFLKIYEMVSPEVFDVLVEEAEARGLPMDGHVPLALRARDVGPRVQSLEHLRNIEMDCVADPAAWVAERRRILANPDEIPGANLRSQLHNLQRLPAVADYDQQECAAVLASMTATIQVPTLRLNAMGLQPPFGRADWDAVLDKLPEDAAADWRATTESSRGGAADARAGGGGPRASDTRYAEWSLFLVDLMREAGVPLGAGTDTPIGFAAPGYSLHSELEMLVRAGLTPMEALEAATVRPAEFFGLSQEMGTVDVGRLADLVLLSADPLADITNTRTVEAVVSKGVLLGRAELDALVRLGGAEGR
jgi:Amidohydrolase family